MDYFDQTEVTDAMTIWFLLMAMLIACLAIGLCFLVNRVDRISDNLNNCVCESVEVE
jgi:hypothetical protein